ncbi:class I SAM-dependent methyltransferase [Microbacterium bovistercoris]|uniref:class I SAM-dependent methyltransferase n=1 Tax=Microbacterium bovistercoris TaxID=2293570 RepID=UPI0015F29D18|nr:methyltransferase domain-containing protein [Microbacterium bovistercoris]
MSLFASTAEYYRRHRSGVPAEVAEILADAAPQGSPRRLLDVGTGPGFVIGALLPWFDEAIGVDLDADLLAVAREELPADSVRLVQAPAESFELPDSWSPHLVTVCRAFHWFERPVFLRHVTERMEPEAVLAVFGDQSIWAGGDDWKDRTREVVQEILGERRRAGAGTYDRPTGSFEDDIADAGFRGVTTTRVPVVRTRTVGDVVGLMHSMSFASPAVLGDRAEEFDRRLRERLEPLTDEHGLLTDHNEFHIILATRPPG